MATEEIPTLCYSQVVYMVHGLNHYYREDYGPEIPGPPIGIFYDYDSAKNLFDRYEDPTAVIYAEGRTIVFLVGYTLNSQGFLLNPQVYERKMVTPAA
jgi:hypothetical protein